MLAMSEHITKRHNKTLFLYHLVCPAKYRREVFSEEVEKTLKRTCNEISKWYEIRYIEIGSDKDYVHFLVQSVPMMLPQRIVQITKSITAKEIFRKHPEVKKRLWGGKFWTSGYYMNTVGQYANEEVIKKYVEEQGKDYHRIYRGQLEMFDGI